MSFFTLLGRQVPYQSWRANGKPSEAGNFCEESRLQRPAARGQEFTTSVTPVAAKQRNH
jgi:hypothetical protein